MKKIFCSGVIILTKFVLSGSVFIFSVAKVSGQVLSKTTANQSVAKKINTKIDNSRITLVDEFLKRASAFGFSGAVLVAKDNKIVLHQGYGLADRDKGTPITTETLFDIGSITKQFTASAIMRLKEMGRLSVNEKITSYFDDVPEDKLEITLHQLLTHTSGLKSYSGEDYDLISKNKVIAEVMKTPLRFKPGAKYAYSNVGYTLLALIIEKVSGQPYEDYVYENIFHPAGLEKTGYIRPSWKKELIAHGYNGLSDQGTPLDFAWYGDGPSWNLRGNGGFISTLGDLFRWHLALEKNSVLTKSSREMMITQQVPGANSDNFDGYGWQISQTQRGTRKVSHSGSNDNYYANFVRYVDEGIVMIFVTNNKRFNRVAEEKASAIFWGAEENLPPKQAIEMSPAELNQYTGVYELPSGGTFTVAVTGGQLNIKPDQPETGLLLAEFPKIKSGNRLDGIQSLVSQVITGIVSKDFEPFRQILREETPFEGEKEFWGTAFTDWQERVGKFQEAIIIGSQETGGVISTFVRLRFERGSRIVLFIQNEKQKYYISAGPPPILPDLCRLVPMSKNKFVTYNLQLSSSIPIRFQLTEGRVNSLTMKLEKGDVLAKKVK